MLSVVLVLMNLILAKPGSYRASQLLILLVLTVSLLYFDGQPLLGSMGAIFCVLVKKRSMSVLSMMIMT